MLSGLLLFCLLTCTIDSSFAEVDPCLVSIEGTHRFFPGDDPRWALPEFDDALSRPIGIPASWQSQGLHSINGMGWYRIRLPKFDEPDFSLGLALGRIGNADEVFLNGKKIGGEGAIGDEFIDAPLKERLYRIPKGLLRFDGTDLIAVRVMNTYQAGGILSGPACIGEFGQLLAARVGRDLAQYTVEIGLFVFFGLSFLVSVFLYAIGQREKEYLAFALFIFLSYALFAFDSLVLYDAGLKGRPAQRAINMLSCFVSAAWLWFLLSLFKEPVHTWARLLIAASVLIGLAAWFCTTYEAYLTLLHAWIFLFLATLGMSVLLAVMARRRRLHESGPILVGTISLSFGCLAEVAAIVAPDLVDSSIPMDMGILLFFLSITYALIARYSRIWKGIQVLSGRILDAQEEERKRLAREIHDGVGQPLLAVKLHLQMIEARAAADVPVDKEVFPPLVAGVSQAIEELRHVAMDLRPALLQGIALTEAFRRHAMRFEEEAGIPVRVQGDALLDVPVRIKDHLYRIYQEALNNIGKHAAADWVEVTVERKGKLLVLAIADNGRGFDVVRMIGAGRGIGLSTMRERAELLGGTFRVRSAPGRGTSIRIEVPIS
jgi:signal transduction histidine kinase